MSSTYSNDLILMMGHSKCFVGATARRADILTDILFWKYTSPYIEIRKQTNELQIKLSIHCLLSCLYSSLSAFSASLSDFFITACNAYAPNSVFRTHFNLCFNTASFNRSGGWDKKSVAFACVVNIKTFKTEAFAINQLNVAQSILF